MAVDSLGLRAARYTLLVGTMDYILRAVNGRVGAPAEFALSQNYPNPFNPSTAIRYQLAKPGRVEVVLYNVRGVRVATLLDRSQAEGYYSLRWSGADDRGRALASGVYFYRITVKSEGGRLLFTKQRRMALVK